MDHESAVRLMAKTLFDKKQLQKLCDDFNKENKKNMPIEQFEEFLVQEALKLVLK